MGKRRFRPGLDVPTRYKPKSFLDRIVETKIKGRSNPIDDIKPSRRLNTSRKSKNKQKQKKVQAPPKQELIDMLRIKICEGIITTRKELEREKRVLCLEKKWEFPRTRLILQELGTTYSSKVKKKSSG